MAKIFTCVDGNGAEQTYEGFWKPYVRTQANPPVIAIVTWGPEVEIWALDHNAPDTWLKACEELQRYYRAEHSCDEIRIAVYDRRLILESDGEQTTYPAK